MMAKDKMIGMLLFNSSEVREPEERLLQAMRVIGSQIGQFVQRKQAEEVLRESEERFRIVVDSANEGILVYDRSLRVIGGNAAAERIIGLPLADIIGAAGFTSLLPCVREDGSPLLPEDRADAQHRSDWQPAHRPDRRHKTVGWLDDLALGEHRNSAPTWRVRLLRRRVNPWRHHRPAPGRGGVARERGALPQPDRAVLRHVLGAGRPVPLHFAHRGRLAGRLEQNRPQILVGKKRWEQDYINMTADDWAAHIAILDARQPFHDLELCRLDESGKKVWVGVSGEPVFDASGVFKGYRGVGKDITERKQGEERIQYLANHDALTSLPNRAMFSEVLNLALQNARRYNRTFAVLFIDLDRFKIINDTLGHEAGDKLLQEMGTRLTETVRSSDVVARLGGDEFVVLVQEVGEPKQVETVARKILAALIKPMFMRGQECRVTASIGICMYPADAQDEQSLMKNADIAMYRAKEEGKNTYQFFSKEMNVHSFERMALETSLRRGLERNEFFLHYQAKLDLKTRRITGVEALVRWQHPDLGVIPPAQFIPLAEETGSDRADRAVGC